jgi:low affinity Fe/Cu permease
MHAIRRLLTYLGTLTAQPTAFLIVAVYALLWAYFEGLDWHGVATLATWCMTLLIQRAEHRDTHGLAKIDKREPEEIERYRERKEGK